MLQKHLGLMLNRDGMSVAWKILSTSINKCQQVFLLFKFASSLIGSCWLQTQVTVECWAIESRIYWRKEKEFHLLVRTSMHAPSRSLINQTDCRSALREPSWNHHFDPFLFPRTTFHACMDSLTSSLLCVPGWYLLGQVYKYGNCAGLQ